MTIFQRISRASRSPAGPPTGGGHRRWADRGAPSKHDPNRQTETSDTMTIPTSGVAGDVKDLALAPRGKARIAWAEKDMPVLRLIRERFEREQAAGGHPHLGLPARHHRDGQPGDHAEGRRRGPGALRQQSALHAGRRGRLAGGRLRHPDLRHQGRGRGDLLPAHRRRARPQAPDDDGRRLRPGRRRSTRSAQSCCRTSSPGPRRRRPASSACAACSRTAC